MSAHETEVPASAGEKASDAANVSAPVKSTAGEAAPMSKNALKRLRKAQEWEDARDDRRKKRKERRIGRKIRAREEKAALIAQGVDPASLVPEKPQAQLVPVALVLDCDFESYMTDKERVSLSSQVTRSYSDNRNSRYRSHLWIAGWGGRLRERFTGVMHKQHEGWKGVGFEEGDFLACADRAVAMMADPDTRISGKRVEALTGEKHDWEKDAAAEAVPPLDEKYADNVVYLTSDSPYTLHRLEANTCYIIGGLVDKNREKGLCYRRAIERGIRTAKLPIGEYMVMQSRQVLATNHVVEIMLRWLECEDWGEAFLRVIPKRKGGTLKAAEADEDPEEDAAKEDEEEEDIEESEPQVTAKETKKADVEETV